VKVVDAEVMARIDARSQSEYSIPSLLLMENAGLKGWLLARQELWAGGRPGGPLAFLCGRGNNGGDALVMARQAHLDGVDVSVVLAGGRPAGGDPETNLRICEALGIPVLSWPAQGDDVRRAVSLAEAIFDGISGTGLRGPLRDPLASLVTAANAAPGRRVAVDVPSGLAAGYRGDLPIMEADLTLAMGLPKLPLYLPRARRHCGKILVVDLGFPPALVQDPSIPCELLTEDSFAGILPAVPPDAHKGDRGYLAVFAGSPGTTGAAWLASHAAARARLGLVGLYLDAATWPILAPRCISVMARSWEPEGAPGTGLDRSRWTGILVGPGWGQQESRLPWLDWLLGLGLPGVIDADGLALLARLGSRGLGGRWVLTPHPGEFSRFTGLPVGELLDDPLPRALELARSREAVVVLKGHVTLVADPDGSCWILDGGNPTLATGGSGDVLAGLVAAGLAAGLAPREAARAGVSLHARLGTLARQRHGWFIAEDLVPLVSEATAAQP
jgi:hydroxyethylthiazole kinase-like uncharacterized protein yjeF